MGKKETSMEVALKNAVQTLSKRKQIELIAQYVYQKFEVFKRCRPLVAGIDKELISALPQYDEALVMRMLGNHCRRPRYIKALAKGGKRYDLKNHAKTEITEIEKTTAQEYLDKLTKQQATKEVQKNSTAEPKSPEE